jgi:dihydrofolate reductase
VQQRNAAGRLAGHDTGLPKGSSTMTRVVLNFTISLDGFIAGADVGEANPMGVGGEALHEWMFGDVAPEDREVMEASRERIGAVVIGRRTFDLGFPHWDNDVPYPAPAFVLTHRAAPEIKARSGTIRFTTAGASAAIADARHAANGKDVLIMGAEAAQAALKLGLVDQVVLQLAPILLGRGTRLFDGRDPPLRLERVGALASPNTTHLTYDIVK